MAKLEWDRMNERPYESGIDKGVLYPLETPSGYINGVAWNGLTSIKETFKTDTTRPYYFDGIKYLDSYNIGDYSATLSAFTYPDEFLECEGVWSLGSGLLADDQSSKLFGLSYRTLTGNAEVGENGYKIHLLYNLSAVPSPMNYQNGSNPNPVDFEWRLESVPEKASNYYPTSHVILDSRDLASDILVAFEDVIYGTEEENARLPSLDTLISIILGWGPQLVMPQLTTGLADLVDGVGDLTETKEAGLFYALPTTRLIESGYPGLYELENP